MIRGTQAAKETASASKRLAFVFEVKQFPTLPGRVS